MTASVVGVANLDVDRPRFLAAAAARLVGISRLAALAASLIGIIVLVGYVLHSRSLVQLYPSLPPMYPNAALVTVVAGASAAGAAQRRRLWRRLATCGFILVAVYGLVTLGLHVADVGRTWLEALWPVDSFVKATTPVGGRPVPETCVAFVFLGAAGALMGGRRSPRVTQGLALGTVSVGAAAVIGFMIGVNRRSLGSSFVVVGMALHTAIALMLLGIAIMLAQPTSGLMGRLTRSGPTAGLGRRLVVAVVIAPILLTTASALLVRFVPDAKLVQSVVAILQVLALGVLVLVPLSTAERVEEFALEGLREARRIVEQTSQRDMILEAITAELARPPLALDDWELGYRQSAAFASLPADTFQILLRGDGTTLVSLIDVAGHDSASALHAFRLRAQLAILWQAGLTLGEIGHLLNESVLDLDTIATGVIITIDPTLSNCQVLNAGHLPILHVDAGRVEEWGPTCPLFGVMWTDLQLRSATLSRSASIIGYTDGITEARNGRKLFLGESSILRTIHVHHHAGAQATADAMIDAAIEHSGGRLRDDAVVFVLRRSSRRHYS